MSAEYLPEFVRYARAHRLAAEREVIPQALSLDEILIVPGASQVRSSDEVETSTELVKGFPLAIPVVSANMDAVTEAEMGIFMARNGGIGIIHRAMSIEEMVRQVNKVKDSNKYIEEDPPILNLTDSVFAARELMKERGRGFVAVTSPEGKLIKLVTTRDVRSEVPGEYLLSQNAPWGSEIGTPIERLVTAAPDIKLEDAVTKMLYSGKEKLPLIDGEGRLVGVITHRDIRTLSDFPKATKDSKGRLRVGVAVGVDVRDYPERITEALKAGADIITIDVLHGDSPQVFDVIDYMNKRHPGAKKIAGNVGGGESAKRLADAGADGIKDGYGDGALCTTQVQTGVGRKQATAIADAAEALYKTEVTLIADGGIKEGGGIVKALALGAQTVMVGTALSGTDQAPGKVREDPFTKEKTVEIHGMATREAEEALASARGGKSKNRAPQGISIKVVYKGDAGPILAAWMDHTRHGIANAGARNIEELQKVVVLERQSTSGIAEGQPHVIYQGDRR